MASLSGRKLVMTESEYLGASENYIGYCTSCGTDHTECEPDARRRRCESCGKLTVSGAQELLISGKIELNDECGSDSEFWGLD